MSTDQQTMRHASRAHGDAKLVQYDEYINRQVESTRRLVKVIDLATALVVLAAGVLVFLLTAAVVEHWLVPSGYPVAVRTFLFAMLAGGVAYFAYRRLLPLCVRAINPVYAAHAIEQSGPTLKNSLINLLLFRERRNQISDAVYQTLEEQAAQRLSRVPIEGAVDQSLLIRFGYLLVAVVAVAGLYKILSPKDPLIAAQRVLMPWADIVPASRVSITSIEPGSVQVSRGEFIDVSAEVHGIGDDDEVLLRFTTEDGQAVDKPLPMKPSGDGMRFQTRLPQGGESSDKTGVAQNLRYRIEAGDARTLDYAVTVVEAPSILVERVEYDFPAYTGYVDHTVDRIGDIRAIEGTRITVHARANGPISEADIDFDADGRRDVRMTVKDALANASFVLGLREDRQTPQHASYVLRFSNDEGRPNRNPVKHSIAVEPDYAPEATILAPREATRDVRLDETVAIDVEAHDPDFALGDVRLQAEVSGRTVIDQPLLVGEKGRRFTGRYAFTPKAHHLREGDIVQYWAIAQDNKTPTPNRSKPLERKTLRIVSPNGGQQPPPDRIAQRDPNQRQQPGQQPGDDQQQGGQQEGEGGEAGEGNNEQPGAAGGKGEGGQNQQPQGGGQQGGQGQQQGDQVSRDSQQGGEGGQGDKETGRQGENNREPQNGVGDAASDQREGSKQGSSDGKQTGAGAAGGESSPQDSPPDGARSDGDTNQRPQQGGQRQDGQRSDNRQGASQQRPGDDQSTVSNEGDNDAEAFERIQKHLEENGELNRDDSASNDQSGSDTNSPSNNEVSRDDARSAKPGLEQERQGDKEKGGQGESGATPDMKQSPSGEQSAKPGDSAADRGEGTGADAKGDDVEKRQQPGGDQRDQTQSPGGEQTSTKGPAGAGDEQESQGSPNSQPEMQPGGAKRQQQPSEKGESDQSEPPAGAHGKKESDSQGEQGGDRAGGGEEGGGQKAPREGTGSAGQNQSADEGAGQSTEQGEGTDSSSAGDKSKAGDRTGQSGNEAGRGSQQREGQGQQDKEIRGQGDKESERQGKSGEGQQNNPADNEEQLVSRDAKRSAEGESTPEGQDASGQQGGRATGGGGLAGSAASATGQDEGTAPKGDEANLEYARKQTDLVLESLAKQLNEKRVDKNLLEELGWTEDDLRKFVARWKARKDAAQRNDPAGDAARRELDEALRSLGLRSGPMQQSKVKEDSMRDLREGYRGAVPPAYQERLRAYNQGVSRARQDGE